MTRTARHTQSTQLRWRPAAAATLALTTLVGLAAFLWPFVATPEFATGRGQDAPWLFAALLGLLSAVLLGEITARGLDAKTIAVLGVLAAAGGALRVLSAGTAGLEPMFVVLVLGGRVLGRSMGFLLGALALLTGAFLTAGIGPWLPFQMLGAGFVPGAAVGENLRHYATFYLATSLGWDLPRAVLTAVLVRVAGPTVLRALRRAVRRAAFAAPATFDTTTDPVRAEDVSPREPAPGRTAA